MPPPGAPTNSRQSPNYGNGTHVISQRRDSRLGPARIVQRLIQVFRAPDYRPPVLPGVAIELLALSRQPNVPLPKVLVLLQREPLIAASVLRLAQSAVYSPGDPVRSLHEAAVRLGMRTLADLFLQAAVTARVFRAPGYDHAMDLIRRHSIATAVVARAVCRRTSFEDEHAFLCGLLHDAGAAACLLALAERWDGRERPRFEEAWPEIAEVHEFAAGELARLWNLPDEARQVITHHHNFMIDGHPYPLAVVVCVADALVSEAGLGLGSESHPNPAAVAERFLGIGPQTLTVLRAEAKAAVEASGG